VLKTQELTAVACMNMVIVTIVFFGALVTAGGGPDAMMGFLVGVVIGVWVAVLMALGLMSLLGYHGLRARLDNWAALAGIEPQHNDLLHSDGGGGGGG